MLQGRGRVPREVVDDTGGRATMREDGDQSGGGEHQRDTGEPARQHPDSRMGGPYRDGGCRAAHVPRTPTTNTTATVAAIVNATARAAVRPSRSRPRTYPAGR